MIQRGAISFADKVQAAIDAVGAGTSIYAVTATDVVLTVTDVNTAPSPLRADLAVWRSALDIPDAERHANLGDPEPVRPHAAVDDFADGVGQCCDLTDAVASDAVERVPEGSLALTYPVPRFPQSAPMLWQAQAGTSTSRLTVSSWVRGSCRHGPSPCRYCTPSSSVTSRPPSEIRGASWPSS